MATPLKSIRRHCVDCMGGSYQAVNDCPSKACPLWQDRSGKQRMGQRPLKAIRQFCLECVGSSDQVRECTGKMLYGSDCQLHKFRFGKNPRLKGKRRWSGIHPPAGHQPPSNAQGTSQQR